MKNSALLLLTITLFSCNNENQNTINTTKLNDTIKSESQQKEPATPKITVNDIKKSQDSLLQHYNQTIDSLHRVKKHTLTVDDFLLADQIENLKEKEQHFIGLLPIYPDEIYLTLLEYFQPTNSIDTVVFFNESTISRSYRQYFTNGVIYEYVEVESGMQFSLSFPTNNTIAVKNFISRMFQEEYHTWLKEDFFGPEDYGIGCHINIKQGEDKIVVEGYCGC